MTDDDGPRDFVKLDRFALIHLAREHALPLPAAHLLNVLALLTGRRSRTWTGTKAELAADASMAVKTLNLAIDDLVAADLIEVVRPFGRNRSALVHLVAWDLIHLPSRAAPEPLDTRTSARMDEPEADRNTRPIRDQYAPYSRTSARMTSQNGGIAGKGAFRGGNRDAEAAGRAGAGPSPSRPSEAATKATAYAATADFEVNARASGRERVLRPKPRDAVRERASKNGAPRALDVEEPF